MIETTSDSKQWAFVQHTKTVDATKTFGSYYSLIT